MIAVFIFLVDVFLLFSSLAEQFILGRRGPVALGRRSIVVEFLGSVRIGSPLVPGPVVDVRRRVPELLQYQDHVANGNARPAREDHGLVGRDAPLVEEFQGELNFTDEDLGGRYRELSPKGKVDLIVIGCPQASVGEARETAAAVRARMELGEAIPNHRLWLFMSSHNYDLISLDGTLDILEEAGALVLRDTCPEVTPVSYTHLTLPTILLV